MAAEEFQVYLSEEPEPEAEWSLKAFALPYLIECIGADEQRRMEVPRRLADSLEISEQSTMQDLRDRLKSDALDGLAWFRLAVLLSSQNPKSKDASIPFLLSALLLENASAAWINALFFGVFIVDDYPGILPEIVLVAHRRLGQEFIESLYGHLEKQPEGFPKKEILEGLQQFLKAIPARDQKPVIRIIDEDGGFTELNTGENDEPADS